MKILKVLSVALIASMLAISTPAFAAVVAKPGSACISLGQVKAVNGVKLSCVKVGAKKVWQKQTIAPQAYSPKGWQGDYCSQDASIKGEGNVIQNFLVASKRCVGAMKIVQATLGKSIPKYESSAANELLNVSQCKLERPSVTQNNVWKGFPSDSDKSQFLLNRHPSPSTVMQIVPIYSIDAPKTGKSPAQDYKFYFDFIQTYFDYINDGPGGIEIRIPDRYYEFSGAIEPYDVFHGNDGPAGDAFINKAIAAIDKDVDFNQVSYSLVVVPAGTPSGVVAQQGFGNVMSDEGRLHNVILAQPATTTGPNNTVTPEMAIPTMWLHEFYHPGLNLGDNHAGDSRNYDSERGMGAWGLMSNNNGDLLLWQKWILGFLQDSQVYCVSNKTTATTMHWLAPSTVKTSHEKLLVIRVSETKALILESIRASGLNYRHSGSRLGALVYEIDVSKTGHRDGYTVMYPDNRRPNPGDRFAMGDSPLKLGESLTYEGVKITNVEWGDFGDVIKVEPVAK
jgi:M6 family metalloprotease-like protein